MSQNNHCGLLRIPERLDTRFGVVAGLYVAALISPVVLFPIIHWSQLRPGPLSIALLVTVGVGITITVTWIVKRWGEVVAWCNTTWVAVLAPAIGLIPLIAYFVHLVAFLGFYLSDLQATTAVSLIGTAGILLGLVASCLGSVLVQMGRSRLVGATIGDREVTVQWTAGWPSRDRATFMAGLCMMYTPVFVLAYSLFGLGGVSTVSPTLLLCILVFLFMTAETQYRATNIGLGQQNGQRVSNAGKIIPWSQFDGFTLTESAIILHRPLPHMDIRCSTSELSPTEMEGIRDVLETHLETKDL